MSDRTCGWCGMNDGRVEILALMAQEPVHVHPECYCDWYDGGDQSTAGSRRLAAALQGDVDRMWSSNFQCSARMVHFPMRDAHKRPE